MPVPPSLSALLSRMRLQLAADRAQNHSAGHAHVLRACAIAFQLRPDDILGRHHWKDLTEARFAYYWICRNRMASDWAQMARCQRGRDHTTALHGANRAEELRRTSPAYAARPAEIEALVWPRGWSAPKRTPSKWNGAERDSWRQRQIIGAIAEGAQTSVEIAARVGCSADGARSVLTRLRVKGAVETTLPARAFRAGDHYRYRIAERV